MKNRLRATRVMSFVDDDFTCPIEEARIFPSDRLDDAVKYAASGPDGYGYGDIIEEELDCDSGGTFWTTGSRSWTIETDDEGNTNSIESD